MLALAVLLLIPLAWGVVAGRLGRWSITAPIAMVAAGVALTAGSNPLYVIDLETSSIEHFVEVVLAVVLFVDATEVEGGFFGKEPRLTARLLLIALPLSLVLAVGFGALTFPDLNFWVLAVIATVVMPTDLAPVVSLIRDRRIPVAAAGPAQRRERVQRRVCRAAVPLRHRRPPARPPTSPPRTWTRWSVPFRRSSSRSPWAPSSGSVAGG